MASISNLIFPARNALVSAVSGSTVASNSISSFRYLDLEECA
jgi:hypothetical protein